MRPIDPRAALWQIGPSRVSRVQKAREVVWTLGRNYDDYECTLISHGEYGVDVQVAKNGVFLWAMRFAQRAEAVAFAECERARFLQK